MTIQLVSLSDAAHINPRYSAVAANGCKKASFLPMAGVSEGGFIVASDERDISEVSKGYTYFEKGDVLLAKITPCLENGKAAVVENIQHQIGFGSTEFIVLRPKEGVEARYVFYMIWNPLFRYEASRNMTGSAGQKRVPTEFVSRFKIPLPTLPEQRRIVAILDRSDAIRRRREESIGLNEDLLRSTFHQMFGDPAINSRKWPTVPLGTVAQLDRGRSRHRPRDEPSLYGGQYPFIQTGDVSNSDGYISSFTQTYSEAGLAQSKLWPEGTLCITIAANIAKTAILSIKACFPDSLVGLVAGERLTIEYVRFWFVAMEKVIDAAATQVAQKNINLEILNKLTIPLPPLSLQIQFSKLVRHIYGVKQLRSDAVKASSDLFGSLVQRAFRGEL
jgi:type I restriction enzyme S subunit